MKYYLSHPNTETRKIITTSVISYHVPASLLSPVLLLFLKNKSSEKSRKRKGGNFVRQTYQFTINC